MKRIYLTCFLWLSTCQLFAGTFHQEFNLNNNPVQKIVNSSNIEIYNTGDLQFWKPIQPNIEAQVTYYFDMDGPIQWALLFANYKSKWEVTFVSLFGIALNAFWIFFTFVIKGFIDNFELF